MIRRPPRSTLFPYTTLFRSQNLAHKSVGTAQAQLMPSNVAGQGIPYSLDTVATQSVLTNNSVKPSSIRSEEHTSELQSPCNLVCRLLLEKKKNKCAISTTEH